MKKSDKLRFYLAAESPTFSNIQLQSCSAGDVSPMTDLVQNLSGASIATPTVGSRRRLSLSISSGTPTPSKDTEMMDENQMDCSDDNRLLKGGIKLTGSSRDQGSFSRNRGFSRRIILNSINNGNESNCGKENQSFNFTMPNTSASTSHTISPHKSPGSLRQRHPLEDYDPNSQDSGYSASYLDKDTGFRFAEPFALPPRRHLIDQSPRKDNSNSPKSKPWSQVKPPLLFHSLSSGSGSDSVDDGFVELYDLDKYSEDANLPFGLNNLLSNPIVKDESGVIRRTNIDKGDEPTSNQEERFRSFHRSFSVGDNTTPNSSRARSCLFKSSNFSPPSRGSNTTVSPNGSPTQLVRNVKRPEPPGDNIDHAHTKRRRFSLLHSISENSPDTSSTGPVAKKPTKLQRCFSESEATIMHALHRSSQEPDLIGDFTKPYLLPLIDGRHQDLKTISPTTLAELMSGKFDDTIVMYSIVDCRYPYEFNGGHINGAMNIYTKEQILKQFVQKSEMETKYDSSLAPKRKHIVVFHCEFSSERGPGLYRFLRNCDRDQNKECYPTLSYPELYLLEGGYKNFFQHHSHLCEPQAYRPMLHPENEVDLRHFRAKSKSWSGDTKSKLAMRSNLKRLGL